MGDASLRDVLTVAEAFAVLGIVGLLLILALVICRPLCRRDEFDAMQQPFGDQPWWRP